MMTIRSLRVFTPSGMEEFQKRWSIADDNQKKLDVSDMIENPNWTQIVAQNAVVELSEFSDREQCGRYFVDLIDSNLELLRAAGINPQLSVELWTWLTAVWSDWLQQLNGKPVPFISGYLGEKARWIFEPTDTQRYYRHLLAGPYLITEANKDDISRARILLYNNVVNPNTRWVETICGSEDVNFNKNLLKALSTNFIEPSTGKIKASASEQVRRKRYFVDRGIDEKGTIDRLTQVYNQLSRTWDLIVPEIEQLSNLLGAEFRAFFPDSRRVRR
jgi:hypothetical protein